MREVYLLWFICQSVLLLVGLIAAWALARREARI